MNYSEMSDFEINKAVHKVLLDLGNIKEEFRLCPQDFTDVVKNTWDKNDGDNSVIAVMRYKDSDGYNPFGGSRDYCNSWADAGPIIQENGINLFASKVIDSAGLKEWEAMSFEGTCHHWGN